MKKMYSRNKLFFGTTVMFNLCFFIGSIMKIMELNFLDKEDKIFVITDQIENIVTGLGKLSWTIYFSIP